MEKRVSDFERTSEVERLYAIAPVGLCYFDTHLRFRYINEWLAQMNGLPVEAHLGHTIDEVIENVAAGIATQLAHVLQTGEPIIEGEVEAETPAHPGESRIYMHDYYPDTSKDGTVVGVSCVVRDITELRQAEETLRESEGLLKQAARTARLGHWSFDHTCGEYLSISEEYARIFGYTADEFLKRYRTLGQDMELVHPEDRAKVAAAYKNCNEQNIEYRIVHADGSVRTVLEKERRAPDALGGHARYEGTLQDITELRYVQEQSRELQESEEQVRLLLDSTAEAIYGIDLDGNGTFVNPACVKMLGYQDQADLLGKNMHEVMHHTRVDGTPYPIAECKIYKAIRESKGTHVDDEVLWRADGSSFPAEYWSYPIRRDGKVIGSVVTFLDTTERIMAEEERATLEEQLRQSQKMEAVGTLAGGIAHDFNNLLTTISGYSRLNLDGLKLDDPLYHDLSEITKASDRATTLTRQLLAFSRKQILQPKVIDMSMIVAEMENLLRRLIGEHIELDVRRDPDLKMVKADRGQMDQVIMNLVVNARDAMPQGGNITMSIENVALDEQAVAALGDLPVGDYVMLLVSDTGVGMKDDTLSHIYEPFFTTKGAEEGTGLGLSTVFGIVSQSGGGIEVESEPGKGSTFRIYLPQVEASAPVAEEKDHFASTVEGRDTIMVVDDEEMIRDLLKRILEPLGYTVLTAHHGEEALLIAERQEGPIDLMITDVVMPQMSGHELAKRLAPLRPDMSVLYISGYDDKMMADQGLVDPERNLLQKPFPPMDVAKKIREILDKPVSTHQPVSLEPASSHDRINPG